MKCKVCGAESGKYPLCRACNSKKETGKIVKCAKCNQWHYANTVCPVMTDEKDSEGFLYDVRKTLISKSEQNFYHAIKSVVPEDYCVFPQINLASFIDRTDDAHFHNELFRNVDFLITDAEYHPKFIIEINDQTHLNSDRKERDEKVQNICEEAGIPILKLWTAYGVNPDYIKKRIDEILGMLPVARIHHFHQKEQVASTEVTQQAEVSNSTISGNKQKKGCYIATCVYGDYDCPQVWTLRRYRDHTLAKTWYGRAFIHTYYAISPTLVKLFGETGWFKSFWGKILDRMVSNLQKNGVENTPYDDKQW